MSRFKKTKIRFFVTRIKNDNGPSASVNTDFWDDVMDYIQTLDVSQRILNVGSTSYEVGVRYRAEIHDRVVYIGKRRPLSDSPMISDENLDETELEVEDGSRIVEPCYLHRVQNSQFGVVSYYKSSSGPHWSAVEKLLNKLAVSRGGHEAYELHALTKDDPSKILDDAIGAKSLEFKVERLGTDPVDGDDPVTRAAEKIYEEFGGQVSVSMKLSFERGRPTSSAAKLSAAAKRLTASNMIGTLRGNIMLPTDGNDEYRSEMVDFLKDVVAYEEDLVEEDQKVSVADILVAMSKAESRLRNENESQGARFTI